MAAEQAGKLPDEVPGLLMPMQGRPWLVPNILVAEIIPYREPERPMADPEWLLGFLTWREQEIPVISVETLNGSTSTMVTLETRLAIINTVSGKIPFYAILLQGIPRLARVGQDDLIEEPAQTGPAEAMYVQAAGDLAVIPDLDIIEDMLSKL